MTRQPQDFMDEGFSFENEEMLFDLTVNEDAMTLTVKFWYGTNNEDSLNFNGGTIVAPMVEVTKPGWESLNVGTFPWTVRDIIKNDDHPNKWSDERLHKGELTHIEMDDEFWPGWIEENRGNPFGLVTIDDDAKTCTTRFYA